MNDIPSMLRNEKKLWQWCNAIVNDEKWQRFSVMVKAHRLNTRTLNSDSQAGIAMTFEAMRELTQVEPVHIPELQSGLRHDLDVEPRKPKTKEEEEKD